MVKILRMVALVLLACAVSFGACRADEVGDALAGITRQMADLQSVQVTFVQEKKMAMFSAPIVMHGTLSWERPDAFAWHVDSPVQYAMIMRQGVARQWDGEHDTVQEFKIGGNPVMRVASQQLQRWFSGNYQQLAAEYNISIGSRQPLVLTCLPHPESPEAGFIKRVSIQFREDLRYIGRITIEEVSGDQTDIVFDNVRLNEIIPADAWRAERAKPHG
ncbi:MAG: outer membrane lipoprotein carrier protein LolA [Candidatus Omnitrophica bacterium]|nr:outer membrane lipoprotein carrier protein LolA [Candidatus Omnitrophota bacterium]